MTTALTTAATTTLLLLVALLSGVVTDARANVDTSSSLSTSTSSSSSSSSCVSCAALARGKLAAAAAAADNDDDDDDDDDDDSSDSIALLWATPLLRKQLIVADDADTAGVLDELRDYLLAAYSSWLDDEVARRAQRGDRRLSLSSAAAHGVNEVFFRHQRDAFAAGAPWPPLARGASALVDSIADAVLHYAERLVHASLGADAARNDAANPFARGSVAPSLFMWLGVHDACVSHLPHTHPDAAVSGVFYVAVPRRGAGRLVLEDPRGTFFSNRVVHRPRAGQLVVFPPWLTHHVSPTCGDNDNDDGNRNHNHNHNRNRNRNDNAAADANDDPRVALSFNVVGDWRVTTDASVVVDTMAS